MSDEARFWGMVRPQPSGCWEWTGRRYTATARKLPYGEFAFKDGERVRRIAAHRYAWQSIHGPIADGLCVCHHCDNPPCVNPAHLFLGTPQDNVDDMISKGRRVAPPRFASRDTIARLSLSHAEEIRTRAAEGERYVDLAQEFQVGESTIRDLVTGRSWPDASGPLSPVGSRKRGRPHAPGVVDGRMKCSRCKTDKSVEDFYPSVARKGRGWCRQCQSAWEKQG